MVLCMGKAEGLTERVHAIDIARAIIIIGVVFSHAIDGLTDAGIVGVDSAVAKLNEALRGNIRPVMHHPTQRPASSDAGRFWWLSGFALKVSPHWGETISDSPL